MKDLRRALLASVVVIAPTLAYGQGATAPPSTTPPAAGQAAPAAGGGQAAPVPEVEVIQQQKPPAQQPVVQQAPPKPKPPKPVAQKPKPKPAPAPASVPPPAPEPDFADAPAEAAPVSSNPIYGASASGGAAERAQNGAIPPVNSTSIIPGNLEGYAGAASRLTTQQLDEQRPLTNHEALSKIPGVGSVDDDGLGRHSNVSVRGSPARRSRKVLMMEDGMSINFSAYLDPSTHYTPPTDRLESIEVLRGNTLLHGPLTNHGVINFRNLSPFGDPETVLKFAIGNTEGSDRDVNVMRHVHTRQNMGNVGVVASYSGAEAGGAWDNEVLTYNDFYAALGFKGTNQDLTISGGYFRQRDHYDEDNFEDGTDADFFANGRDKAAFRDFAYLSSYNADYWRIQATHNLYIDQNTTLTTKAYYSDHERNRYFERENDIGTDDVFMRGRERDYEFYGVDSRIEFANLPLFGGTKMDVQVGGKAERHTFLNCNVVSAANETLDADNKGRCDVFEQSPAFNDDRSRRGDIEADAYAVFMQAAIHVTEKLTVTPGLRFESYDIERNLIRADDEAGDQEGRTTSEHDNLLPAIGLAWEALPMTTVYAGWHRGITPAVTRGTAFPIQDEKGDNYQIGVRSTAIKGLAFDIAYFHSDIENYQIKEAVTSAGGLNIFGRVDEVEINGVELAARLESKPFTGGPWNFFGEGVYTYADSIIEKGLGEGGENLSGNKVPEVPEAFANLTLGFAHAMGFDASVTWTYRGEFFTDDLNSAQGEPGEEALFGPVDDVWLLSARANYKIPNTNATLFVSGQNLEDELYIADRSDGAKPGQGRTIMGGFTYKFD